MGSLWLILSVSVSNLLYRVNLVVMVVYIVFVMIVSRIPASAITKLFDDCKNFFHCYNSFVFCILKGICCGNFGCYSCNFGF